MAFKTSSMFHRVEHVNPGLHVASGVEEGYGLVAQRMSAIRGYCLRWQMTLFRLHIFSHHTWWVQTFGNSPPINLDALKSPFRYNNMHSKDSRPLKK